jgi:hypothetical protein
MVIDSKQSEPTTDSKQSVPTTDPKQSVTTTDPKQSAPTTDPKQSAPTTDPKSSAYVPAGAMNTSEQQLAIFVVHFVLCGALRIICGALCLCQQLLRALIGIFRGRGLAEKGSSCTLYRKVKRSNKRLQEVQSKERIRTMRS